MVRTSALSTRWRHLWTSTALDIGHHLICGADLDCDFCLIVRTMDTIVSRHRGPLRSFTLAWETEACVCGDHSSPFIKTLFQMMEVWAEAMARRGIENVTMINKLPPSLLACPSLRTLRLLDFDDLEQQVPSLPPNLNELKLGIEYDCMRPLGALPGGVVASESLCSLELTGYILEEPFGMQMPPNLRELRLRGGIIFDNLLERVLSQCKLLDTLDVYTCFWLQEVRIKSCSLRKLRLHRINKCRSPLHLLVEDVPNLELLIFDEFLAELSMLRIVRAPKLQSLGRVNAYTKMLQLENTCFQDGFLKDLNTHIYNLRELSVHVSLDDANQAKLLADLLRCFPCLECLEVEVSKHSANPIDEDYWELEGSSNCLDHHLKVVKFKGFSGQPNNIYFARYLIRNSRMLRSIYFLYQHKSEIKWIENKNGDLLLMYIASLDVEVIFHKGHCDD